MSGKVNREKRRLKRMSATKNCNALIDQIDSMQSEVKSQRINLLNTIMEDLKDLDDLIFTDLCNDDKITDDMREVENEECSIYTLKIVDTIGRVQASMQPASAPVSPQLHNSTPPIKFNLPQIPLPSFSNKPTEDLTKFLTNFEQVIDKFNLPEYEKFLLLQKSLSGDPATIIKSLELSNQNYTGAKNLLTKAFSSKSTQQFNAISQLSKLKFRQGDDPYKFISASSDY